MTSYQANFASHHIRNRHVGFLFIWGGIWKYNKMYRYFFYSDHIIIPNCNWVTRILAHTLGRNFYSFYEVNYKFKPFLLFFSIPHHTKRKPSSEAKLCAYGCVPCCANPLYMFCNGISLFMGWWKCVKDAEAIGGFLQVCKVVYKSLHFQFNLPDTLPHQSNLTTLVC